MPELLPPGSAGGPWATATPPARSSRGPDIVPLLDVIFAVLACFAFLVASSEPAPDSLQVDLPEVEAAAGGGAGEEPLVVRFDATGRVTVAGEPLPEEGWEIVLRERLAGAPAVRLHGDRQARHGLATRILALAREADVGAVEIAVEVEPGFGMGPVARSAEETDRSQGRGHSMGAGSGARRPGVSSHRLRR